MRGDLHAAPAAGHQGLAGAAPVILGAGADCRASEAWKHPDKREYFFGALDENRVQLSIGRDVVLSPKQAGSPLNYFVYPYAEVDGKPYTQVTKSFAYKDVTEAAGR